jgi:tripartite-type tricarboxylate transporter receptor subunit TctC
MKHLIAVVLFVLSASAYSAEYKFIIPNAVGGGTSDLASRKLSQMYQERFGDSLIVTNIPGAQGTLAIEKFKQEHIALTILISSQMVYNFLDDNLKLTYTDQDFNIIAPLGYNANLLVTSASSPIKNLDDYTRIKNPSVGSWQIGSDLAIQSLATYRAQTPTIVRYRDPAFMIPDLVSGVLPTAMTSSGSSTTLELVKTGKLKILGSSAPYDIQFDGRTIPSMGRRYNIPQFDYKIWLAVSPGDSAEHVKLVKNLRTLLDTQEFQEFLKEGSLFPMPKENTDPVSMRQQALKNKNLLK